MRLTRSDILPHCTACVSRICAKFGAFAPRTRYIGRSLNLDHLGQIESGIVKTSCSFLTASGFERELEVPVIIYHGELVDPAFAMVHGNPVLLSEDLFKSISDRGSIFNKPVLGTMYSTAYANNLEGYKALNASLTEIPKLYRPLY